MKLIRLPTVVIAVVIVHNTNADHSCDNRDIARCPRSECKIRSDVSSTPMPGTITTS
jgi:hypothetical protein